MIDLKKIWAKIHKTSPTHPPKGQMITGTLAGYWEQGMEGRIDYAFYPEADSQPQGASRAIWLENGQYLRIFAPDDQILWAGVVQLVPRRRLIFYEHHHLPHNIWSDYKQKGLSYGQWIAWFWQHPPLRAELILPQNRSAP